MGARLPRGLTLGHGADTAIAAVMSPRDGDLCDRNAGQWRICCGVDDITAAMAVSATMSSVRPRRQPRSHGRFHEIRASRKTLWTGPTKVKNPRAKKGLRVAGKASTWRLPEVLHRPQTDTKV